MKCPETRHGVQKLDMDGVPILGLNLFNLFRN